MATGILSRKIPILTTINFFMDSGNESLP